MILNALEGKPLPVYGTGSNVRDWLFVEDHARGLTTLLDQGHPGDKYNFGGDSERSNLAVVELICDTLDRIAPVGRSRRSLINFVVDRPGHDLRYAIDASYARSQLGWSPQESFESGLERTIHWYLEHREWWGPLRLIRLRRRAPWCPFRRYNQSHVMKSARSILVVGRTGQLARALAASANKLRLPLITVGRPEFDLSNAGVIDRIVASYTPRAIINAAAYTFVDEAELEFNLAFKINRDGAAYLAGAAARLNVPFIHVSTDYVFDGKQSDTIS